MKEKKGIKRVSKAVLKKGKKKDAGKKNFMDEKTEIVRRKLQIKAAVTHHIGGRESQQDNYGMSDFDDYVLASTKGRLAIMADGMGGLANGAEISGIVVASLLDQFKNIPFDKEISAQLLEMVYKANEEVRNYVKDIHGEMSGSTLVAADILDGQLYFVSVGDSRIYLIRGNNVIQLNREDVYLRNLYLDMARGKISYESAMMDNQRDALTGYIGMEELKDVDFNLNPINLCKGDKVLLMSDGVFGTLSDREICQAVLETENSAEALECAVLLKNKPRQDNFTAVILNIE